MYLRAWIDDKWRYFKEEQVIKEFKRGKNKGCIVIKFIDGKSIVNNNLVKENSNGGKKKV